MGFCDVLLYQADAADLGHDLGQDNAALQGAGSAAKATSVSASLKVSSLAATSTTEMPATKNVGMQICSLTSARQT